MQSRFLLIVLVSAVAALSTNALALENGLARTPPMGWNTWNRFGCDVSEPLIRESANAIVSSGMREAGYQYVVLDDCWQQSRDVNGNIVPDSQRFPSGMRALSDYIHSKGLLFGIDSDAGSATCQNRPGSLGHEFQDARQYASWGVDYLKYDWCHHDNQDARTSYTLMRDALRASGREIVFSICEWGSSKPWLWAADVGNLWRSTADIVNAWSGKQSWGGNGVLEILDQQVGLESYAGPGHWNDPDMLEVGNPGLTLEEARAHFSMWCILAAPLMAGNDLRTMDRDTAKILTNKEAIAIDQDVLGHQGRRIWKQGDLEVWSKQLTSNGSAVALLNRSSSKAPISVEWSQLDYPDSLQLSARDVWAHKNLGMVQGKLTGSVAAHSVLLLTLRP